MSEKKKVVVDERDEKNFGIASRWALKVVVLYTIVKMIYYLDFHGTKDLSFLLWDGVLLLVIALTLFIGTRVRKTYNLPKTYREGKASTGNRKDRIKESYLPKALLFSAGATVASGLRSGFISILVTAILFLVYFIVIFLGILSWGEFNVKSYNKSLDD